MDAQHVYYVKQWVFLHLLAKSHLLSKKTGSYPSCKGSIIGKRQGWRTSEGKNKKKVPIHKVVGIAHDKIFIYKNVISLSECSLQLHQELCGPKGIGANKLLEADALLYICIKGTFWKILDMLNFSIFQNLFSSLKKTYPFFCNWLHYSSFSFYNIFISIYITGATWLNRTGFIDNTILVPFQIVLYW